MPTPDPATPPAPRTRDAVVADLQAARGVTYEALARGDTAAAVKAEAAMDGYRAELRSLPDA